MTNYQLTHDAEEINRIMEETVCREPKVYAIAVIIWHILCWIRKEQRHEQRQ